GQALRVHDSITRALWTSPARAESYPWPSFVRTRRAATERKTGVKHAEVVTARLAQDDRGWLRLAG
ncbi:MAG: hypothetical protein M3T56_04940, partial [Chloroflexota bacterium]|nr:hypothetical protein [Chloroflexota bacterium]